MAIIKYGHIVAEARGKLNGTVFSRNTYGAYMRAKVTPSNPKTTAQSLVRSSMTVVAQGWRGITQAQRDAWNSATVNFTRTNIFGDNVPLTGFNLYGRINRNLQAIGQAVVAVPPVPEAVAGVSSVSLAASAGGQTVTLTYAPAIPATQSWIVRFTPGQSAGKQFVASEFRQVDVILTADSSPFSIETEYIAKFGSVPAEGQKIFVELIPMNTTSGIRGTGLQASALVAA